MFRISNRNTFQKCWYNKIIPHLGILWCDSSVTCNCLSNLNKINRRKCERVSLLHLRVGYMDGWVNDVTTSIKTALTLMSLSFNNPPPFIPLSLVPPSAPPSILPPQTPISHVPETYTRSPGETVSFSFGQNLFIFSEFVIHGRRICRLVRSRYTVLCCVEVRK